ncbi:MAG: ATP-binding protein [Syntrophorhabdales bacterium]
MTERHLRSSIIITSNRPPQDWVGLFPDPVMANSALDRLAHVFTATGEEEKRDDCGSLPFPMLPHRVPTPTTDGTAEKGSKGPTIYTFLENQKSHISSPLAMVLVLVSVQPMYFAVT